jgi:hypothetical protein
MAVLTIVLTVTGPTWAGPYSGPWDGISYDDPRFVGWATGVQVSWPTGFVPSFNDPSLALGAAPGESGDVVTLGNGGSAVLSFGVTIADYPGPDLAVFENGFNDPIFVELAFVEVSTDGTRYARFPSVSLTGAWPGEIGAVDATDIHNLAGKHINNYDQAWTGTPFDLTDLANHPLVLAGHVHLDDVRYVRIVDVYGHSDGTTTDAATLLVDPTTGQPYPDNHVIYDGGNSAMSLTGFDLDAVGVLRPPLGDANDDGKVDGADLAVWQQNYDPLGANPNVFAMGDFNGDGRIDGGDLAIWQQHYDPLGGSSAGAMSSVPEPGTMMLLLPALMGFRALRKRKN